MVNEPPRPAPRKTAQQQIDDLREEISAYQKTMTDKVGDLRTQTSDLVEAVAGLTDGAGITLAEDAQNDHVEALVLAAMEKPLEKANQIQAGLLARLEEAERVGADLYRRLEAIASGPATTSSEATVGIAATLNDLTARLGEVERKSFVAEDSAEAARVWMEEMEQGRRKVGDLFERVARLERAPAATVTGPHQPLVYLRVLDLMRQVGSIAKERTANLGAGGRYQFRGIDQAMDEVGRGMRDVGLVMETRVIDRQYQQHEVTSRNDRGQEKITVWTTARVVVQYTLICPDDGSTLSFQAAGEGRDSGDKATSKAMSMACKYALFQGLMIPVAGLDESDGSHPAIERDRPGPQEDRPAAQQSGPWPGPGPDQPPPAPPEAPAQRSKAQLVQDAYTAIGGMSQLTREQATDKLNKIMTWIEREGLATEEINGATLRAHILATMRTLNPAPPSQPDFS